MTVLSNESGLSEQSHFLHRLTESKLDITSVLGYTNYMENILYIFILYCKEGESMAAKKKKQTLILVGFPIYAITSVVKCLHIFDSRPVTVCLTLIQYIGMLLFLNGIHYFGTTYQYAKYPEESRQTVIDQNDERTRTIHDLAKARTFDIITYVLILLPFLLIEAKAGLTGIICSFAALIILGVSYGYYRKFSKEM